MIEFLSFAVSEWESYGWLFWAAHGSVEHVAVLRRWKGF